LFFELFLISQQNAGNIETLFFIGFVLDQCGNMRKRIAQVSLPNH